MTDLGKEFIKKMFNMDSDNSSTITINGTTIKTDSKGKILDPKKVLKPHEKLQQEVEIEEAIVKNKIKLKALKSITDEDLSKAFGDLNVDQYISSIMTLKVVESIKRQSHMIVNEALEDLSDNYIIKNAIKVNVVNKIKEAFK